MTDRRRFTLAPLALLFPALLVGTLAYGLTRPRQTARVVVPPAPLRALLVGGGPDLSHNQVAIESNLRYVRRLLPPDAVSRILFTDGDPRSADVLYEDGEGRSRYRVPHLPALDGPSRLTAFDREFASLKAGDGGLLLYFTGHGGPSEDGGYDNNEYDMWANDALTVRDLAAHIDTLPPRTPVVLVMVQCFSGGFGNVLFRDGDPNGPPVPQDLCGFFASIPSSEAAGCTPAVNEADYHDFTGYFFAALSGQDRLGRPVTGADYDHDGRVGMNEAFAYSLIHDTSIDTPTCTSDVFLRRFVKLSDREVSATTYPHVVQWAAPAQRAALEALSQSLHYTGDDRLAPAFAGIQALSQTEGEIDERDAQIIRFVRLAKSVVLAHALQASGSAPLKARYAALLAAESRNPLTAPTGRPL